MFPLAAFSSKELLMLNIKHLWMLDPHNNHPYEQFTSLLDCHNIKTDDQTWHANWRNYGAAECASHRTDCKGKACLEEFVGKFHSSVRFTTYTVSKLRKQKTLTGKITWLFFVNWKAHHKNGWLSRSIVRSYVGTLVNKQSEGYKWKNLPTYIHEFSTGSHKLSETDQEVFLSRQNLDQLHKNIRGVSVFKGFI